MFIASMFFIGSYRFNAEEVTAASTKATATTEALDSYKPVDSNAGEISCNDIFGDKGTEGTLMNILYQVYKVMRVAGVVLLVFLSMVDFTKAVASSDADKLKSVSNKFIKRLVILIAFFLIPAFISFIFDIVFGNGMSCRM